jgi:hypothetical protein
MSHVRQTEQGERSQGGTPPRPVGRNRTRACKRTRKRLRIRIQSLIRRCDILILLHFYSITLSIKDA